ncbi:Vps8-like protein [Capsaspora owczarzaki ATCC 30864]|uniref:Vps8-like protein n=1 Tax=Capsaspora owczarzaki (strain ATCC 30864) TaxID=595528 RepID=A0A0D2UCC2_CAPO3|nr:Vps8-like protein [Capsaspora owczarzaki ATCC 30864]
MAQQPASAAVISDALLQQTLAEDLTAGLPADLVAALRVAESTTTAAMMPGDDEHHDHDQDQDQDQDQQQQQQQQQKGDALASSQRTGLGLAPLQSVAGHQHQHHQHHQTLQQQQQQEEKDKLSRQRQLQLELAAAASSHPAGANLKPTAAAAAAAAGSSSEDNDASSYAAAAAAAGGSSSSSGGDSSAVTTSTSTTTGIAAVSVQDSVVRKVPLNKISSQLTTDITRKEAGLPTCIASSARFVAIGASHGLAIVYDYHQRVRFVLGSTSAGMTFGPITAICLSSVDDLDASLQQPQQPQQQPHQRAPAAGPANNNNTSAHGGQSPMMAHAGGVRGNGGASSASPSQQQRASTVAATGASNAPLSVSGFDYLLAGFEKGHIAVWELQQGKLLKVIDGVHDRAILNITAAVPDLSSIVSSDARGAVFSHNVRRVMGIWVADSKCLVTGGGKAAVSSLVSLPPALGLSHPLDDLSLVAMTTKSKVHIVALRPQLDIMHTFGKEVICATEEQDAVPQRPFVYGQDTPISDNAQDGDSRTDSGRQTPTTPRSAQLLGRAASSPGNATESTSDLHLPCLAWRRCMLAGEARKRTVLHPMVACSFANHVRLIEVVCNDTGARGIDLPGPPSLPGSTTPQQAQRQQASLQQQHEQFRPAPGTPLARQSSGITQEEQQLVQLVSPTSSSSLSSSLSSGLKAGLASIGTPLTHVGSAFTTFMSASTISFVRRGHLVLDFPVTALQWLGASIVIALDGRERLNVIDAQTMQLLQTIDVSDLNLLFHTRFQPFAAGPPSNTYLATAAFNSIFGGAGSSGGSLSRSHSASVTSASSVAAVTAALRRTMTHHQTMCAQLRGSNIFLVGQQSVVMLTLLTWSERIAILVRQSKFLEALALAKEFYDGTAKAIIGLPLNAARRREIVSEQMTDLLLAYLDISISTPPAEAIVPPPTVVAAATTATEAPNNAVAGVWLNVDHVRNLVSTSIEYCLAIDRHDLLMSEIFDRFCAVQCDYPASGRGVFLERLEPYVLSDRIRSFSPIVMQAFVEHYLARGFLQRIERCLVHMDVANLDLHQVITMCRQHRLYTALIYVYNRGLFDYVSPMEELVQRLYQAVKGKGRAQAAATNDAAPSGMSSSDFSIGYKLLLYMSFCLTGRAFPAGMLPAELLPTIKSEVYHFLLARASATSARSPESPSSPGEFEEAVQYPNLRALLMFDIREFLKVLDVAFEDAALNPPSFGQTAVDEESASASSKSRKRRQADAHQASATQDMVVPVQPMPDRQLILDILFDTFRVRTMAAVQQEQQRQQVQQHRQQAQGKSSARALSRSVSHPQSISPFSAEQMTVLFAFVARQLLRFPKLLTVEPAILDLMVRYLTNADSLLCDASESESKSAEASGPQQGGVPELRVSVDEREQALISLYHGGLLNHIDEDTLLIMTESAQFFKILESLYEARRQYAKILAIYLRAPNQERKAISYVHRVLSAPQSSVPSRPAYDERGILRQPSSYTAQDNATVREFAIQHALQLSLADRRAMAKVVMLHFPEELAPFVGRLQPNSQVQYEFLRHVFDPTLLSSIPLATGQQRPSVAREPGQSELSALVGSVPLEVNERYIELLCEYAPSQVYAYLRLQDNYRLEECLRMCKKFKITDATAWLLERSGDIVAAFELVLASLKDRIVSLCPPPAVRPVHPEIRGAIARAHAVLLVAIQLCQRNANRINENERDQLWFQMLDTVMEPQRQLNLMVTSLMIELKSLTQRVLSAMMGYVPLKTVLYKVLQDPNYSSGNLGDIKDLVIGMVDTYNYEAVLLETTNHMIEDDLITATKSLARGLRKGLMPRQDVCSICELRVVRIAKMDDALTIFHCGHAYHMSCLVGDDAGADVHCVICSKKQATGQRVPPAVLLNSPAKAQVQRHSGKRRAVQQEDMGLSLEDKLNDSMSSSSSTTNAGLNVSTSSAASIDISSGALVDPSVDALRQLKRDLLLPSEMHSILRSLGDDSVGIGLGGMRLLEPNAKFTRLQIAPPSSSVEREKRRRERVAGAIAARAPGSLPKRALNQNDVPDLFVL